METTTASGSAYEQQSVNSKNKRKKFNPKFLSSNSSSDDDGEAPPNDEEAAKSSEDDKLHNANNSHNVPGYSIPNTNFSITKSQNNNDSPPPTLLQQFQGSKAANPFLSPSKLSLLQTFGNFQQQQQLLQQAVSSAASIAPNYQNQQQSLLNLSETEAKFREFAFKTMQELLNIYGLSISPNDIVDALKQQHLGQSPAAGASSQSASQLEPPTPPRTPVALLTANTPRSTEKLCNNNNDDAKENFEENSGRRSTSSTPIKLMPNVTLTPTSKLIHHEQESEGEDYSRRQYNDDSNLSDDNGSSRMGRQSVVSGQNGGEDSEHESELYDPSSYDSSKLSLKNVENMLDKTSPMSFYNPMMHLATMQTDQVEKQLIAEYSKYLTKYQSYLDCHTDQCQMENQREHYHCYDIQCCNKTLNKKEEIIRHLKWHKKRSESLNHGFLRFTSSDDCTVQFGYCQHNRKQTHYHCIQSKCDKTYISTSDVQMHSNYHRKDSAIYQEGFQRYRATEKCTVQHCIFYGQCTTHFHCRRCKYTFKNKADMEKHKTYHMKDEQLFKDGFKKFLKTEPCKVDGCRFTLICNHIHCVRSNCTYVLHSSGQLLSHKRKHERMDAELAYRRFKMGQNSKDFSQQELAAMQQFHGLDLSKASAASPEHSDDYNRSGSSNLSPEILQQIQMQQQQQHMMRRHFGNGDDEHRNGENGDSLEDGIPKSVIQNPSTSSPEELKAPTVEEIEQIISQYFTDQCTKQQSEQNEPLNLNLKTHQNKSNNLIECFMTNQESHLHCLIPGCEAVVPRSLNDISEHLRMHELTRGADSIIQNSNLLQITSIEGFFNRKRGRPPKNRVVEVYNNAHHPPQAIFTSFKLERNDQSKNQQKEKEPSPPKLKAEHNRTEPSVTAGQELINKVQTFQSTDRCGDLSCVYRRLLHYHCGFSKYCHYSTNQLAVMNHHLNDFHTTVQIQENYDYFDRNYDCKLSGCSFNKIASHFHCLLCRFSFAPAAEMSEHVCEENIEDSYENFDLAESEANKSFAMQRRSASLEQNYQHHEKQTPAQLFEDIKDKIYSHPSKIALSNDVDLIKTNKLYIKPETEDDKISVIRAAGTYFPENSEGDYKPMSSASSSGSMGSFGPKDDPFCDKPFCKLRQKKHSHCDLCNQAFTDAMKLKIHYLKHQQTKLGSLYDGFVDENEMKKEQKEETSEPHDMSKAALMFASPPVPQPGLMDNLTLQNQLQLANLAQLYQQNYYQTMYPFLGQNIPGMDQLPQLPMMQFPFPAALAGSGGGFDFSGGLSAIPGLQSQLIAQKRKLELDELSMPNAKIKKVSERPKEYKKSFKDDSVPTGYLKFRFNQDCNFPSCGYRNHQSHFHCCRKDCFYSFCDKTRFVQHTARHERLDKLMGDDFKQYRANMHCGNPTCGYNKNLGPHNKSSHFHCLKCTYICSDTNKVVAHRRQHSKQEYIRSAGFRKISNNEHCNYTDPNTPDGECVYTLKQTHYHCLVCQMAVLSRAQLPQHRHRITPGEEGEHEQNEDYDNGNIRIEGDENGSDDNDN